MKGELPPPSPYRRAPRVAAIGLLAVSLALAAGAGEERAAAVAGLTGAVEQLLGAAEAALEQREPQIAESHYRTALREGWLQLGALEVAAGDLPAARAAFEQAARATAAGLRMARLSLALVQIHTGQLERAVSALEALASERPGDLQTRMHLVHALVLAGRLEQVGRELEDLRPRIPEAVARLERTLAQTEDDPQARHESFLPPLQGGRLAELSAAERSQRRARLRATQVQIYRNLGVLHARAGRPGRAAGHFARADEIAAPPPAGAAAPVAPGLVDLRQTPPAAAVEPLVADEDTLWETRTAALLPALREVDAGRTGEAERVLRRLVEEGDDPAARVMLAVLLAGRERYDEAEAQLLAAIDAATDVEIPARQHLARLYLMRGREDLAASQLRAAAALGALERDLALKLAEVEQAAGREAAARELLWSVVRRHRSVRALLALAATASTEAGPESAQALLRQARGLAPSCEEVLARSGRAWLAAGRAEEAVDAFAPLARMHPEVAEYADLLRRACARLGDPKSAKQLAESCRQALRKAGDGAVPADPPETGRDSQL